VIRFAVVLAFCISGDLRGKSVFGLARRRGQRGERTTGCVELGLAPEEGKFGVELWRKVGNEMAKTKGVAFIVWMLGLQRRAEESGCDVMRDGCNGDWRGMVYEQNGVGK